MPDSVLCGSQKLTPTTSICFTAEQQVAGWAKHTLLFSDGVWVVPALRLVWVVLLRAQRRVTRAAHRATPPP